MRRVLDTVRDICVGLVAGGAVGLWLGYRLWASDADDEPASETVNPDSERPRPDAIRDEIDADVADRRRRPIDERVQDLEDRARRRKTDDGGGGSDLLDVEWPGDGGREDQS